MGGAAADTLRAAQGPSCPASREQDHPTGGLLQVPLLGLKSASPLAERYAAGHCEPSGRRRARVNSRGLR